MINIKKATIQDIPILYKLLKILFSQEVEFVPNQELQEKGLKTIIKSDSLGDIFVAYEDKKIVAMVNILYSYSTALGNRVAIFEDMVVDPLYRGKEIGSQLISYVVEYLKQNDFKRVTLLTDEDNLKAHNFYEKNGFEVSSMKTFRKKL